MDGGQHDLGSLIPAGSPTGRIEMGTIGWDNAEEHFVQGTEGTEEEGYTLVRVQLFRGRSNASKKLKATTGQGTQMLCHISSGLFRIPKKGERCFVMLAAGYENMDASGVIVAIIKKTPFEQFSEGRVKMDFGSDEDLVIKARSVTISDYNNDYMSLTAAGGFRAATFDGGLIQVKGDKFTAACGGGIYLFGGTTPSAGLVLSSVQAQLWCGAGMFKINAIGMGTWIGFQAVISAGSVSIGALASPATPCGIFPGLPSTSVFISP
jgi:hypothetical protein